MSSETQPDILARLYQIHWCEDENARRYMMDAAYEIERLRALLRDAVNLYGNDPDGWLPRAKEALKGKR